MNIVKNSKAFTLVELMIVIAVIGILAVVLIPKLSSSKDSAKVAGIESNMRAVRATVGSIINNYDDRVSLRDAIITKLDNVLKNPFNGGTRAFEYNANYNNQSAAVKVIEYDRDQNGSDVSFVIGGSRNSKRVECKGQVTVAIFNPQGALQVSIYAFDGNGDAITTKEKVLRVIK